MKGKHLIIIAGPTAIGKTSTAIQIATALKTEIVSADSRQLYTEMNIGVARPSELELSQVKHHFIAQYSITENFSAGRYERECIALLDQLFNKYDQVVLAGGSGLYIKAIVDGLDEFPEVSDQDINYYQNMLDQSGIESLQIELQSKDPATFQKIDSSNARRLIRALSVIKSSGKTYSSFTTDIKKERNFKTIPILLEMDRQMLYDRINNRVDQMMNRGLLKEVKFLHQYKDLKSLDTVGYRELFDHIDGQLSLEDATALIKRNSRRYAKRQVTWFNNTGDWHQFPHDALTDILSFVNSEIAKEEDSI